MNTSNERDELIMKAVVDMNGDWLKGSGNGILALAKGDVNCIFLNQGGYWITGASWHEIFSWVIVCEGEATPICTIAEFEEAAAKWKERQSAETPKVDLSQMYCPVNSPDIEAYKKVIERQLGRDVLQCLEGLISEGKNSGYSIGVRANNDGFVTRAKLCWYQHQTDYIEFKVPKTNYEELTFGELPRDEKLKLVEHVRDGGKIERYDEQGSQWSDKYTGTDHKLLFFVDNKRYRIKHVEPITEKELFLLEAKHYESIEQMFDSGKFKLVADAGEE